AAGVEDSGTDEVGGWFWSVLCIFWLPSIYSMGVAGRARFELRTTLTDGQLCRADLAGERATSGAVEHEERVPK
ncbi:MAG: hypothetical protein WA798_13440, partial [Candidatus Acidiferrum sp.]